MDAEITIIGAGVIGLAIAEKISQDQNNIFLIEKNPTFGQETSSRNSEVIHAGIYYPQRKPESQNYALKESIFYTIFARNLTSRIIIAVNLLLQHTEAEIPVIEGIKNTAAANGVDLSIIERDQIINMEPEIFALKALWSPTTGIVDSHSLMKRFETNILNNGGQIVYSSEVTGIKKLEKGYEVSIINPDKTRYSFTTETIINSAGLTSDKVAEMAGLKDENLKIMFCKGDYFRINPPKNRLISRLIYPVPHHNMEGIGIHVTIDMSGGVKLGPDVTYLDSNNYDYRVDPSKQEAFWSSARKFLPFLEYNDIAPEMAGIRPKIQKPGDPIRDFYIMEESKRGYNGFINLIGMESPGLTSCLAIANYVYKLIRV